MFLVHTATDIRKTSSWSSYQNRLMYIRGTQGHDLCHHATWQGHWPVKPYMFIRSINGNICHHIEILPLHSLYKNQEPIKKLLINSNNVWEINYGRQALPIFYQGWFWSKPALNAVNNIICESVILCERCLHQCTFESCAAHIWLADVHCCGSKRGWTCGAGAFDIKTCIHVK